MSPPVWLRAALLSMHTDPAGPLGGEAAGGMNVYVRELARALPALGVRADVFTRAADARSPSLAELAPGARLVRIPAGPRRPLHKDRLLPHAERFARGIEAFAGAEGYGLLSCHYWLSGVAGERLARAWGAPLALRFHTVALQKNEALSTAPGREGGARLRAEARLARRADALLASSPAEAEILAEGLGVDGRRIRIVPCGVDLERFAPLPRARARAALGLPEGAPLILSVGRLDPIKGLDRLVDALALLRARRPRLALRALHLGGALRPGRGAPPEAGCPPEDFATASQRAEARRILGRARKAGVAELFRLAGPRAQEDLPLYYSAADALALPSRHESFGLVALEAAACGLPAVGFRVGGLPQAVEDGGSGLLLPEGDVGAFAEALLRLIEDPAERARLGARARERAGRFSWSAVAAREVSVWKKLLGRAALAAGPARGGGGRS